MKGDPGVMTGLNEAAEIEASLMLQYALNALDLKRLGLSIADGFKDLHEQAEGFWMDLTAKLLFLEGAPTTAPKAAKSQDTIDGMLGEAMAAELAAIARFTSLCRAAYEVGDMEVFHFYQHLVKWHRTGGNGNKGHIKWLQKQLYQFSKLGETEYIAAKV
jgi:bacterioferritin (cytochrome b1)